VVEPARSEPGEPVAAPRRRRAAREWPLVLVGAGVAAGLLVLALPDPQAHPDAFRVGLGIVGGSMALAALLRAVLPALRIGSLTARSRVFDVVVLALGAAAVVVLAFTVPGIPPA